MKANDEILEQYGRMAFGPEFGTWADMEYEEGAEVVKRPTMVLANENWTEPIQLADGEYSWNWAYDAEMDTYFLLLKWHSGVRLPIAFARDGAGKMLYDSPLQGKFDVMVTNKRLTSGDIFEPDRKFVLLWDVEFKQSKAANWPAENK